MFDRSECHAEILCHPARILATLIRMENGMKLKLVFLVALLVALVTPAAAQTNTPDPEKIQSIRRLVIMVGADKIGQIMVDQMLSEFRRALPPEAGQDVRVKKMADRLGEIISEEMKKVDLVQLTVDLYDKYFTADDIKALIAFYSTPAGQKAIQVLPALMQESMQRGGELGRTAGFTALQRWLEEFPEMKDFLPAR